MPPERVLIHGKSLGGGVAIGLAAEVHPGALVLESTFTSVRAIARRTLPIYPVGLLLRHPFDSDRIAPRITVPTLVLHSRGDAMIPFEAGRQVAAHIPGARFVPLQGNNHVLLEHEPAWPHFLQEVRTFLASIGNFAENRVSTVTMDS